VIEQFVNQIRTSSRARTKHRRIAEFLEETFYEFVMLFHHNNPR
jgi:hypothetical protein